MCLDSLEDVAVRELEIVDTVELDSVGSCRVLQELHGFGLQLLLHDDTHPPGLLHLPQELVILGAAVVEEVIDANSLRLAWSMRPRDCLILAPRVPRLLHENHVVRARELDANAASVRRDEADLGAARVDRLDGRLALVILDVPREVDDVALLVVRAQEPKEVEDVPLAGRVDENLFLSLHDKFEELVQDLHLGIESRVGDGGLHGLELAKDGLELRAAGLSALSKDVVVGQQLELEAHHRRVRALAVDDQVLVKVAQHALVVRVGLQEDEVLRDRF